MIQRSLPASVDDTTQKRARPIHSLCRQKSHFFQRVRVCVLLLSTVPLPPPHSRHTLLLYSVITVMSEAPKVVMVVGTSRSMSFRIPRWMWDHLMELPCWVEDGTMTTIMTEPVLFQRMLNFYQHGHVPPPYQSHELLSMAVELGMDDLVEYLEEQLVEMMSATPRWTVIPESPVQELGHQYQPMMMKLRNGEEFANECDDGNDNDDDNDVSNGSMDDEVQPRTREEAHLWLDW
jgi:hypothetical protein